MKSSNLSEDEEIMLRGLLPTLRVEGRTCQNCNFYFVGHTFVGNKCKKAGFCYHPAIGEVCENKESYLTMSRQDLSLSCPRWQIKQKGKNNESF